MTAPTRPLINYFGAKWNLAPWIISNFPDHSLYVEPFGGSASVLLRKPRSKREILNDVDSEIVNLYQMMRDYGTDLKHLLKMTPHSRDEYHLSMEPHSHPLEKARRTVVRCYFGIGDSFLHNHNAFRNSKDSNTSVAKSWANYHDALDGIIQRFAGVTLENLSYERIFEKYDSTKTLWYLDPPYPHSTRTRKHSYREEWSEMKHMEFLSHVLKLKGRVILSSYPNDLYSNELSGWAKITRDALTNGAQKRTEIIYIR